MDSYPTPPNGVVLDIDDTCDVVHRHQQLSLFNAHYDERRFVRVTRALPFSEPARHPRTRTADHVSSVAPLLDCIPGRSSPPLGGKRNHHVIRPH